MEFSLKDSIIKQDHVLLKQVGDAGVLLNLHTESYYGLDPIGYDFYNKLISATSIENALQEILEEYEADPQILKNDLLELVSSLLEAEIIKINAA